jgi:hypothetical protein
VPAGDTGLFSLAMVAAFYRIACDPAQMAHDLGLGGRNANAEDIFRAARRAGLKSRILRAQELKRLYTAPLPAIVGLKDGSFAVSIRRRPPCGEVWTQLLLETIDPNRSYVRAYIQRQFSAPVFDRRRCAAAVERCGEAKDYRGGGAA